MEIDFERDVYPHFARIADAAFRCPDMAARVVALAWYNWMTDGGRQEPRLYANFAIRQVLGGRDVPGVKGRRDVFDRLANWGGGGMEGVADPLPGPDRLAEDREAWAGLEARESEAAARMVAMTLAGASGKDIAAALGVTQGRVSQMKRQAYERFRGAE